MIKFTKEENARFREREMEKENTIKFLSNEQEFESFCHSVASEFAILTKAMSKSESKLFQKFSNLGPLVLLEIINSRNFDSLEKNYEINYFTDDDIKLVNKLASLIYGNLKMTINPEILSTNKI